MVTPIIARRWSFVCGKEQPVSNETIGILLGGFIPALLLGVFAMFQKLSVEAGAKPGTYLLFVSGGVFLVALVLVASGSRGGLTVGSASASFATGLVWALAVTLIAVAQGRYGASVARLVPLFNMNTLVAVVLGFLVFAEWRGVNVPRLSIGAVLIVIGGSLVATA
jgi:transporter family protein